MSTLNDPSKSSEDLVFNYRTLRLIIGALAFAFPAMVIALTGKVTTSISASYHEAPTRDVFVGFLFVIGGLLISYKGHPRIYVGSEPATLLGRLWAWLKKYQENVISTVGGFAAIFTALYPTACDGCAMDSRAVIHTSGAFILFFSVVYFSLIAFLRSLNEKLLEDNPDFAELVKSIKNVRKLRDVHSLRELGYRLFPNISSFLRIASQVSRDYDRNDAEQIEKALHSDKDEPGKIKFDLSAKPGKLKFMWLAYDKKLTRGIVYVLCGSLILVTLVAFILVSLIVPGVVAHSIATFVVETIALVLFGIAWMTASKLEYITKILEWWESRATETSAVAEAGAA